MRPEPLPAPPHGGDSVDPDGSPTATAAPDDGAPAGPGFARETAPPPFPPPLPPRADAARFAEAARRCADGRADLLRRGHAPDGTRRLRRFSLHEAARLLDLDPAALRAGLAADPALPRGEGTGDARRFALEEIHSLRSALPGARPPFRRPADRPAKIVAAANFKGGVGKTALAAHLAMAAALDGARVLAVDLDSQASLSALLGAPAEDAWGTAYALLARHHARTLEAAGRPLTDPALAEARALDPGGTIRATHWPGLDLIGAQLDLYWAEFQVPVWRLAERSWRLWDALGEELEAAGALDAYDVIVLDTPPALGYLTINALAAADVILTPLGASFVEFDSTGRFFDMLHATFASIEAGEAAAAEALGRPAPRFEWDALMCVLTRYDAAQQREMAAVMESWLGDLAGRARLDATALVGQAGEQVKAIYEADPRDFNRDTWRRGRDTFDGIWAELRGVLEAAWARDAAEAAEGAEAEAGQGGPVSRAKPDEGVSRAKPDESVSRAKPAGVGGAS